MTGEQPRRGLIDTNVVIHLARLAPDQLPNQTPNPSDFAGLEDLLAVVAVTRLGG